MKDCRRLKFLRIIVCLGLLAGIFGSLELWFPVDRSFPRAPMLFELPENLVFLGERFLTAALVLTLALLILWPGRKIFFGAAFVALAWLIVIDQTRLQPWVYQYWLILTVFAFGERKAESEKTAAQTLGLVQALIAGLYFWSGLQKLNFSFFHETVPVLLAPLENLLSSTPSPVLPGLGIALTEMLTGAGLLFRKTRAAAIILAVTTHLVILGLLIFTGYNRIVWIWNAALILLVVTSFWQSRVSLGETLLKASGFKEKAAATIVTASLLLPALNFFGWWDAYLSGALYSGNTETAVIRINEALFEKLPPKARKTVFQPKSGEMMLPLFEWAVAEMSVPVYPEKRVFRQVARKVCRAADERKGIELIVKERPAIVDGNYRVSRIGCAAL